MFKKMYEYMYTCVQMLSTCTYVAVFLLYLVQEVVEVGSTEVRDGTQASKQTSTRQLLEVALTNVLQLHKSVKNRIFNAKKPKLLN